MVLLLSTEHRHQQRGSKKRMGKQKTESQKENRFRQCLYLCRPVFVFVFRYSVCDIISHVCQVCVIHSGMRNKKIPKF